MKTSEDAAVKDADDWSCFEEDCLKKIVPLFLSKIRLILQNMMRWKGYYDKIKESLCIKGEQFMKKLTPFILICSLLFSVFSVSSESYAKTSTELKYSSKKVAKITHIEKVYEILEWFDGLSFNNCDYENSFEKYNSYWGWKMTYYRVKDNRFKNMNGLKKYLKKYFSPDYVKKLLKQKNFIEKNGKLYYGTGERGGDPTYVSSKYRITKKTAKERIIKVTDKYWFYYESGPDNIEKKTRYFKQKKINGKWVFTKISLPY